MESRQHPIGAERLSDGFHFRAWAPGHERLVAQLQGRGPIPLRHEGSGYYACHIPGLKSGTRYQLQLDGCELISDPASRFQPEGPHGSSQLVDPHDFQWTDRTWVGRPFEEYVIYEMHIGTFTQPGTWLTAAAELPELASIGITCVELMPIAESSGRWGWGYDGLDRLLLVNLGRDLHLTTAPEPLLGSFPDAPWKMILSTEEPAYGGGSAHASFNDRCWCEPERSLYDVVDGQHGDDSCCRPNQIFAISLEHPVLEQSRWSAVVGTVSERLLTPVGLRTLAPGHPDYEPKCSGDLRSRDAAYHQGTVCAWLIGPFIDAWCRVYPERRHECRQFLSGFDAHLNEACVGTISEIFDGEAPFTSRCAAQAWSVAEVLRATLKANAQPQT